MVFSDLTTSLAQSAKQLGSAVRTVGKEAYEGLSETVSTLSDCKDVLDASKDVVASVVSEVSGKDIDLRALEKASTGFDEKYDVFAQKVNEAFNSTSQAGQANILETLAKDHFGDKVFEVGGAVKNNLGDVLGGAADFQDACKKMREKSAGAQKSLEKVKKGVDGITSATQKVAGALNHVVEAANGNGLPVLDRLSKIGANSSVQNLSKVLGMGVDATTAAAQFKNALNSGKAKNPKAVADVMAEGAKSVSNLIQKVQSTVPNMPGGQALTLVNNSLVRLNNAKDVYDAGRSVFTSLVADASGKVTPASLQKLINDFNTNWDKFSATIDTLFRQSSTNGQKAVLQTMAESLFGENVFYAGGAIKRQLPGVMEGVGGLMDAYKMFGGSYRNPLAAAKKIRDGVEKMVSAVEKIADSLNKMVKHYQGLGDMTKGTGFPLLKNISELGDSKVVGTVGKVLAAGGGAADMATDLSAFTKALEAKDYKKAFEALKKGVKDAKKVKDAFEANGNSDMEGGGVTGLAAPIEKQQNKRDKEKRELDKKRRELLSMAQSDSYVCSGARMRCSMGTSEARLTVLPNRTVFLTGQPMANISDHLSMVNLAPFGRCRSLGFPSTASATAAHHGHLTPMPCMHNTPFPWMGGKNDYLIKGEPALLKSSTCSCMWGGTISLITDGQRDTGSADLSRIGTEEFDKNQQKLDVDKVLDGIQLALDAAGFIPGAGAIPDLTNAAISALRGNWGDAGLSLLAAVPLIGDTAAAAKIAKKGLTAAKEIKGTRALKETGEITHEQLTRHRAKMAGVEYESSTSEILYNTAPEQKQLLKATDKTQYKEHVGGELPQVEIDPKAKHNPFTYGEIAPSQPNSTVGKDVQPTKPKDYSGDARTYADVDPHPNSGKNLELII